MHSPAHVKAAQVTGARDITISKYGTEEKINLGSKTEYSEHIIRIEDSDGNTYYLKTIGAKTPTLEAGMIIKIKNAPNEEAYNGKPVVLKMRQR